MPAVQSHTGRQCQFLVSAPRVVLRVQGFQAFARDMGVDGGGGYIGMPQQHLHRTQIRAVIEQMRGESVAQGVRRELLRDTRLQRVFAYQQPKRHAAHGGAPIAEE